MKARTNRKYTRQSIATVHNVCMHMYVHNYTLRFVPPKLIVIVILAGSALVKCGVTQRKLGECERDFMEKTMSHFLYPLRNFLEGDMKTITVSIIFN